MFSKKQQERCSKIDIVKEYEEHKIKVEAFRSKSRLMEIAFRFRLKNIEMLLDKHSHEILQGAFPVKRIVDAVLDLESELIKQDDDFFDKIGRLEKIDEKQMY